MIRYFAPSGLRDFYRDRVPNIPLRCVLGCEYIVPSGLSLTTSANDLERKQRFPARQLRAVQSSV